MIARRITLPHVSKDSHIIVRVENDLRARLERIAIFERRKLSDLARIVFEDYVRNQERNLNLVLRDHTPASSRSALAEAKAAIVKTVEREVSYRTGKAQVHKPHPKKATK